MQGLAYLMTEEAMENSNDANVLGEKIISVYFIYFRPCICDVSVCYPLVV